MRNSYHGNLSGKGGVGQGPTLPDIAECRVGPCPTSPQS